MVKYYKIGNITGIIIILTVTLCCCINSNIYRTMNVDNYIILNNTTTFYNTTIISDNTTNLYNTSTYNNAISLYNTTTFDNNGTNYTALYIKSNNENNKLNNLSSKNNSHKNKTYIKYPKIINYTILEYGKYSKEDREYYYSYIDKLRNKTIIFIYGGKRPVDYSINIVKIVKSSNNSASIYVERLLPSPSNTDDFIITSPYIVLEINGTIENINIEYIQN